MPVKLCYQSAMGSFMNRPWCLTGWPWPCLSLLTIAGGDGGSATGHALLDAETLQQFTGGDEALRLEILQQFLDSVIADVAALETALGGSDLTEIRRCAHRAKGASRMVGANAFAATLEALEHAAGAGSRGAVDAAAPEMRAQSERLQHHLRQQLGG